MPRTAKSILKQCWNRAIPVDVDALKWFAANLRVNVIAHVRHDDFCGEYLPVGRHAGDPPLICYNVRKPAARQSFAIAHCLGHHVLGHGKRPKETGYDVHTSDQREKDANAFAVELLMPEEAVREYIHHFHMEHNLSMEALSRYFHVEPAVMALRLHSLGIETAKISAPSLKRFPLQGHTKNKLHASNYYHGKHALPNARS
jgi:Zn-dependent peptidase ImmA (M78 family)